MPIKHSAFAFFLGTLVPVAHKSIDACTPDALPNRETGRCSGPTSGIYAHKSPSQPKSTRKSSSCKLCRYRPCQRTGFCITRLIGQHAGGFTARPVGPLAPVLSNPRGHKYALIQFKISCKTETLGFAATANLTLFNVTNASIIDLDFSS